MTSGLLPSPDKPRILIWGGRSQARISQEMIHERGLGEVSVIFDASLPQLEFSSAAAFVNDAAALKTVLPSITHYVVCIAGEYGFARHMTSRALLSIGLKPLSLVHESALIERTSTLLGGAQIMPRAVVHKFCEIGEQVLLNTNCTIDHECRIGNGVHVMGAAAVTGRVVIGDFATIGTNATILPDLKIGEGAFVAAGAVVTRDVPPNSLVVGCPAKVVRQVTRKFDESAISLLKTGA